MRKRALTISLSSIGLFALAISSDFSPSGYAQQPASIPDGIEIDPVTATAGANPGINYSTGFEPGEGFPLGYISNSGGTPAGCGGVNFPCWAHFAGSDASLITPTIENNNPASGVQHLRLIHDPSTRTNQGAFALGIDARYPRAADLTARPVAPNTVSVDIAISNPGGMSFRVQPQSPSQGIPATSVLFHYTGEIMVYYGGCEGGIQPTGHFWDTTGAYENLTISMDPCEPNEDAYGGRGVVRFYYRGDLIYTGCPWGTSLEHIIIIGDNYPGSHMDVDNVVMTSLDECPDGACCDTNGPDQGCTDNVLEADCTGADKVWTGQGMCDDVVCDCILDCQGATCGDDGCGGSCGTCDDGNVCNGSETCNTKRSCDAGTPLSCNDGNACNGVETCDSVAGCRPGNPLNCNNGLACDGLETCNPSSGCVAGTPVNCNDGRDCSVDTCVEPAGTCEHDDSECFIPTVSQWGLIVLALVLLVAAKVQFGRVRGVS